MANYVYFGNSVNDKVSVNVNEALQNLVLDPRSVTKDGSGKVTAINCAAVQCPTGADRSKGVFGTGGGPSNTNTITIQFDTLEAGDQVYEVTANDLSGRDLYIYVFDGSLVGQDETGRDVGIDVKKIS